ncbi:uncharacterized protein LACBIDRAFT_296860 [Laccaria bicolor S238N-H82]|uniref:Predicted protein n=1 Tax=Laccaria bicolor (strain S238N-H82 / ATCC MYA-4686) TaxID=486041 RepID=B0D9F6_LACBS|nr:uncharacterized protein LACBIDRAFT_296860 [Laccaria bicolor S238N-H82]EDR08571.1 predicted protein [Laccaria bicolor S238N-H82]|eukprot:XP_001880796.1 predicted protein [Laccaria bicolor S238N-H82]
MKVPVSALEGCLASFIAADERRTKASTQFFADTGLMAMLCRHDHVLWLVNMTTAGERQYYALVLIKMLFMNLPLSMTVGILYDIGCQLERCCQIWGFLEEFMARILFALVVFHAYGHQWPCQLVYHPHKCEGFGLSDGEGCERFWSAIKLLIPSMRVAGFYHWLFTIDTQVKHLDKKSFDMMGKWLQRKWLTCLERKIEAEEILNELGFEISLLENEWKQQVAAQTKPLAQQSKNIAIIAIKEILALYTAKKSFATELGGLDDQLISGAYEDDMSVEDVLAACKAIMKKQGVIDANIKTKKKRLGVKDQDDLRKLMGNKFLQLKLNARALKQRLRDHLRNRKFELERLERAYQQTTSNETKLHSHVQKQINRQQPTIARLAKKYNDMCYDMTKQIQEGKASGNSIAPVPINQEHLFALDVDEHESEIIPGWLGNENICEGITAMLIAKRCAEEMARIKQERTALQEWSREEWEAINMAIVMCEDEDIEHQLVIRKSRHLSLCAQWREQVSLIPDTYPMLKGWGPDIKDMDSV